MNHSIGILEGEFPTSRAMLGHQQWRGKEKFGVKHWIWVGPGEKFHNRDRKKGRKVQEGEGL